MIFKSTHQYNSVRITTNPNIFLVIGSEIHNKFSRLFSLKFAGRINISRLDLLSVLLNRQGAGLLVRPRRHLKLPDPGVGSTSGQHDEVGQPPQTKTRRNISKLKLMEVCGTLLNS